MALDRRGAKSSEEVVATSSSREVNRRGAARASRAAPSRPSAGGDYASPQDTVGFHSENMPLGFGFQTHAWIS